MSCKSLIYTANTSNTAVAVGGVLPLGTVNRRYGCNIDLSGNGIVLTGTGYYDVDSSFTATATAAGNVTITMLRWCSSARGDRYGDSSGSGGYGKSHHTIRYSLAVLQQQLYHYIRAFGNRRDTQ